MTKLDIYVTSCTSRIFRQIEAMTILGNKYIYALWKCSCVMFFLLMVFKGNAMKSDVVNKNNTVS